MILLTFCKFTMLPKSATSSTYAMCEGFFFLRFFVKVADFKVPMQYSWDVIAQCLFKLGHVEWLVIARV